MKWRGLDQDQRRLLNGGVWLDVQPGNGTRYDLVAMLDPNGGVLISWPITGWIYRYYPGCDDDVPSEIKQLGRDGCRNEFDLKAIHQIMDNWVEGVKQ